ncbi:hypothetical protein OSTOST_13724 [Ostertagia ostertagi]
MQNDEPFGGKVMVIGGDFRQVLPVVEHGQREDFVDACVHKSFLWTLILHSSSKQIGNGECNDADSCIQVPEYMMCYTDIVTEIFGVALDPNSTSELCESAILGTEKIFTYSALTMLLSTTIPKTSAHTRASMKLFTMKAKASSFFNKNI